jgi:acyl carrier protein
VEKKQTITLDSDLVADLDTDSLNWLMIVSALEDEFDITIAETEFQTVHTVRDIIGQLRKHGVQDEATNAH